MKNDMQLENMTFREAMEYAVDAHCNAERTKAKLYFSCGLILEYVYRNGSWVNK